MADQHFLQIVLTLKDEALQKLTGFQKAVHQVTSGVQKVILPLTIAAGAVSAGFGLVMKDAVAYGTMLDKMAKTSGIVSEEFSRLAYAAEQEHASIEALTKVMPILARHMEEARQGSQSQMQAFNDMGIAVTETSGKLKSTYEILLEAADYYARAEDKTKALAQATQLLGKSGAELVPFLQLGKAGIQALGDEADKLGIVMDTKTSQAFEQFGDELGKLKSQMRGVWIAIAKELLPVLSALIQKILQWDWKAIMKGAKEFTDGLIIAGAQVVDAWNEVVLFSERIKAGWLSWLSSWLEIGLKMAQVKAWFSGDFLGAKNVNVMIQTIKFSMKELMDHVKELEQKAKQDWSGYWKKKLGNSSQGNEQTSSPKLPGIDPDAGTVPDSVFQNEYTRFIEQERKKIETSREIWKAWHMEKTAMGMTQVQAESEFYSLALDTQKKAHESLWPSIGKMRDAFTQGMSKMCMDMVKGTLDAKKAFQELGFQMIQILIDYGVQLMANAVLGKAMMAAQAAMALASGAATASAWAPAASMVSLASFGANAAPAASALTSVTSLAHILAIPKLAEGGKIRQSGIALVGEEGPELVHLPKGAEVSPHGQSCGQKIINVTTNVSVSAQIDNRLDIRQLAEDIGFHIQETLRGSV